MIKQILLALALSAVVIGCSPSAEQKTGKTLSGVGNLYKASANEVDKNWQTSGTPAADKKEEPVKTQ